MATTRARYAQIDVHGPAPAWPSTIEPLTEYEAVRVAARLWKWAEGEPCPYAIVTTSGKRYTWLRERDGATTLVVNAEGGWRRLAHDLSHLFWRRANPSARPHEKGHARFEARLIREIIRRGWLDGKLREKAPREKPVATAFDERARKLSLVLAGIKRWEAKERRAKNALQKLHRRRRGLERAIAKAAP